MPQIMSDDNRYTLFSTQRRHVLQAANDLLMGLDEKNEKLSAFIKMVKRYMDDYATHPQININFLNLLKDASTLTLLPRNKLLMLQKALKDDQTQMSQRNLSYVSKRNSVVDNISIATFLLSMLVSVQFDDTNAKLPILFLGYIVIMGIQQLKINDSVNDWDYLGVRETIDVEATQNMVIER